MSCAISSIPFTFIEILILIIEINIQILIIRNGFLKVDELKTPSILGLSSFTVTGPITAMFYQENNRYTMFALKTQIDIVGSNFSH